MSKITFFRDMKGVLKNESRKQPRVLTEGREKLYVSPTIHL
jgi:hypothetical protein